MKAIIDDRGKQYTVKEGDIIAIDKIDKNPDDKIEFENIVLLTKDNGDVLVGTPYIKNTKITATVVKQTRDKKIIVFKFKNTRNYIRTKGHKQKYTIIKIDSIVA